MKRYALYDLGVGALFSFLTIDYLFTGVVLVKGMALGGVFSSSSSFLLQQKTFVCLDPRRWRPTGVSLVVEGWAVRQSALLMCMRRTFDVLF